MAEYNILKGLFTLFISPCVRQRNERAAGCMKTGLGLMLHEDRGEFILMGKQPLKPGSHDFFISRREQEVSQLTGVNAANCAADKRGDAEERGGEEEGRGKATAGCCLPKAGCVRAPFAPLPPIAAEDFTEESV